MNLKLADRQRRAALRSGEQIGIAAPGFDGSWIVDPCLPTLAEELGMVRLARRKKKELATVIDVVLQHVGGTTRGQRRLPKHQRNLIPFDRRELLGRHDFR